MIYLESIRCSLGMIVTIDEMIHEFVSLQYLGQFP